jgi:hypothetical protein
MKGLKEMKRCLAITVFLIGGIFSVAEDYSFTTSLDYRSQYIVDTGSVLHDGPVIQLDFFATLPHGVYADVWVSVGPDGEENFGDEIDLVAGWANDYLDLSVSYYDLARLSETNEDIVRPALKVYRAFKFGSVSLTPFAELDWMHVIDNKDYQGSISKLGLVYSLSLGPLRWNHDTRAVYATEIFGGDPGWNVWSEAKLSYTAPRGVSIKVLVVRATIPLSQSINDREREVSVGAGISLTLQ